MKIKVDAALMIDRANIAKALKNTLGPYDLYVFSKDVLDNQYIALASLPEFEIDLSAEKLIREGLAKIAADREKLKTAYQKGLQELRNQESDLQMLAYAPASAEAEDITFNEPQSAESTKDDIPF